jgi:hypothetical protein
LSTDSGLYENRAAYLSPEQKKLAETPFQNPEVISVHNCKNEHAHFMTVGLLTHEWQGEASVCEPDEIIEWKWFDLKDLPYPRYFPSFEVIENYLAGKFYVKR